MIDAARWEKLTTILYAGGVGMTAAQVIVAVFLLTHGSSGPVAGLSAVASLVFIAGAGAWIWQTRQLLRSLHDDAGWVRYQWPFVTAFVLIVLGYAVLSPRAGATPSIGLLLIAEGLRIESYFFGLVGLRLTRDRVRGIASGEIAAHSDDPRWQPPIVPAATTVRYETPPAADRLSPADESFWASAGRLARDAGADIAVLETAETQSRRWLLVPADGDTTALRATIRPGAILTLFPTAPGTAAALGATGRKPAPEYYGLIQTSPHDPVRFQLILPSRVPHFLAEAGTAHRAGLYRANDPAARTAAVPASVS